MRLKKFLLRYFPPGKLKIMNSLVREKIVSFNLRFIFFRDRIRIRAE